MAKIAITLIFLMPLMGCIEDSDKDQARSLGFEKILKSKLNKAADDMKNGKISNDQYNLYEKFIKELLDHERIVRAGYK